MEENSDGKFDALHISIGGFCKDLIVSCLNVIDDGGFEEGYLEIVAFSIDAGAESACKFIELDCIVSNIDCFN